MSTDTELNYLGPVGTERFIANVKALLDTKQSKEKYGKLVVFGDSIGQGVANNNYSYVDILEESGAFESVAKHCVSGATVGPYAVLSSASGYSLVEQVERYSNDVTNADIVICEYEGNDVMALMTGAVMIGSVEDDSTATTVCGYTKKAIKRILELNPSARIIWVPVVRNNFEWLKVAYPDSIDTVDTYLLYEATVLKIVSSLGCSIISAYTGYSIGVYLVDGVHPNTEGHKLIAEKILSNMFSENEYIIPTRPLTLTNSGFDGIFTKILALLKAGVDVRLTYAPDGIGPNKFRAQYFDSTCIYFDGVITYDGVTDYICRLRWRGDGNVDTIQYNITSGGSSGGTDLGNEYEISTDGWTTLAYAGSTYLTAAEPTVTKTESYIDVSQPTQLRGGSIVTTNAINITNFTKLEVDLSNVTLSGNGTAITISIIGRNWDEISMLASKTITASAVDRTTHEIDVTNLTGNVYISIHLGTAQNGSASCRVNSVKLFKSADDQVEYALKTDIPTKNSELTNDSGFITSDAIEDLRQKTVDSLWNGELYANGNEYEIVTGGWWTIGYVFTQGLTAAAPTINKQDSYMDVSLSGNYVSGLLSTSDDSLIDVTDFDKIQVEVSNVTIDNATGGMWLLLSDENDNYSGTTKITADGIIEKDISGLSGKYHVVISFAVVSGTNSLRIHKAKLIKNGVSDEISVTADSIADALGYIPADVDDIPTKTSQLTNDSGFITGYTETDPTVPAWAKAAKKPTYTAAEVGAEPSGTAASVVSGHNTSTDSHNDIRLLVQELTTKVNNFLDSDDTTLDELSELVTAIKANAGTISQLTSGKVNVADIINNLTTNVTNKPLSAAQGVALKGLIDGLNTSLANYQPKGDYALKTDIPTKTSDLTNDSGFITGYTETDPTVPAWAKAAKKPTYTAAEVGALPSTTTIPSKTSQLTNDSGFITSADITTETVPSYVVTEAESVIDRVVAAQGDRTFTFAAISDLHYGNSSYTDGILHACQALKYIDSRIRLDAVAVLGDYTDGYPSTGIANAMGDFKSINALLDNLRFAPNLRQQGNHDYYPDNIPITRRLIQYYSDDVTWGSRSGGYYYKDFSEVKMRVICPNTNENNPVDSSTNKPSSSLSMTAEQMNWLISVMDLSGKSDAEEWGILILSHHPLDYWTSDSTYILGNVLNAYQAGGSWSGNGVSCNFSGKNTAKLIGNIHGHIHNLLVDNMFMGSPNNGNKSEVYRSCVPNACFDRENQYTGTWGEATTYAKTKNSAADTAFMIYCVDLDKFTVKGICYGAGDDRSWTFGEVPLETYTITNNLTHISNSNTAETITEGMAYTATLTPTGASITSVKVTMGGTDVTSSVYSGGVISIPAVSGNIVITAVGEAKVEIINLLDTYGYSNNTRLSSSSGTEKTQAGHVATGYIYVGDAKVGDVLRTSGIDFSMGTYPDQGVYAKFDASKTLVAAGYLNTSRVGQFLRVTDASGNVTLTCDLLPTNKDYVQYIRLSGVCADGANAIITKNQEIV